MKSKSTFFDAPSLVVLAVMTALFLFSIGCLSDPSQVAGPGGNDQELDAGPGEDAEPGEDAGPGEDASQDADASVCTPMPPEEICQHHSDAHHCGVLTVDDDCGQPRQIDCEQFQGFGCHPVAECVENDDGKSTCICPELNMENEDEIHRTICDLLDFECGVLEEPGEICGEWDELGPILCGMCADGVNCNDNICGCPCELEGTCYALGAAHPDNPCMICDGNDEFIAAQDQLSCTPPDSTEFTGHCESGTCEPTGCTSPDLEFCSLQNEGPLCVDTASDPSHCGGCETQCSDGYVCSAGSCDCIDGRGDDQVCTAAGAQCGTVYDNCDEPRTCNDCPDGQVCLEQNPTSGEIVGQETNQCVQCIEDEHCPNGFCQLFQCVDGCSTDDDCGDQYCHNNQCVTCYLDSHCPAPGTNFEYCAANNCVQCKEADHCAPGQICSGYICCDSFGGGCDA